MRMVLWSGMGVYEANHSEAEIKRQHRRVIRPYFDSWLHNIHEG